MLLILISVFSTNIKQADAYYYCSSSETRCAHAYLYFNGKKTVTTQSVYFSKGETIAYQWRNVSPGIQHVAFAVMSGTTQISPYSYAPAKGNNYNTIVAPSSGYLKPIRRA